MITLEKAKVDQQLLEQKVKEMYREIAQYPEKTYHFETGKTLALKLGYPSEILDKIPIEAVDSFAGVGYFFDFLDLKGDEHIVDLGSGSGMDVFFASHHLHHGHVFGIDMTNAQLEKANNLRDAGKYTNISFHKGYIEKVPLESGTADAVISNGVINLSSDKQQVFNEIARILKPGGKLAIADIVSSVPLPENITCNANLWAACIGGAVTKESYLEMIANAGMAIKDIQINPYSFISKSAKGATVDYGIMSISLLAEKIG